MRPGQRPPEGLRTACRRLGGPRGGGHVPGQAAPPAGQAACCDRCNPRAPVGACPRRCRSLLTLVHECQHHNQINNVEAAALSHQLLFPARLRQSWQPPAHDCSVLVTAGHQALTSGCTSVPYSLRISTAGPAELDSLQGRPTWQTWAACASWCWTRPTAWCRPAISRWALVISCSDCSAAWLLSWCPLSHRQAAAPAAKHESHKRPQGCLVWHSACLHAIRSDVQVCSSLSAPDYMALLQDLASIMEQIPHYWKEAGPGKAPAAAQEPKRIQTFIFSATLTLPAALRQRLGKGASAHCSMSTMKCCCDQGHANGATESYRLCSRPSQCDIQRLSQAHVALVGAITSAAMRTHLLSWGPSGKLAVRVLTHRACCRRRCCWQHNAGDPAGSHRPARGRQDCRSDQRAQDCLRGASILL